MYVYIYKSVYIFIYVYIDTNIYKFWLKTKELSFLQAF